MSRSLLAPLALLFALCAAQAQAQTCPDANYFPSTQAQVDAFPNTCSEITGGLSIGHPSSTTDITDLSPLAGITSVGGGLSIYGNAALASLSGLSGITSVGAHLNISNNDALTSLDGLDGIPSIAGFLFLRGNDALVSLDGLGGITSIGGDLSVNGNAALTTVDGLSNLESVGGYLLATFNASLTSLDGFAGVTSVGGDIDVQLNDVLTSLDGLDGFSSVGGSIRIAGNPVLESLGALSGVTSVGGNLFLSNNDALTSLAGLDALSSVGGGFYIAGNAVLASLDALGGIPSIPGDLSIQENPALTSLAGLDALTSVGNDLLIANNAALESLGGIGGLASLGNDLNIYGNAALTSLGGLDALTSIPGTLRIANNAALTSPGGLDGITSIGGELRIGGDALTSLDGLGGVTSVGSNLIVFDSDALTSIAGLIGITSVGGILSVQENAVLPSLDGLDGITSVGSGLFVSGNGALTTLDGLDGLTSVGNNLFLRDNPLLAECAVGLAGLITGSPPAFAPRVPGAVAITNNAVGGACTSPEDVLAAILTATLTGAEGFRMLAHPAGGTVDDILGSVWTQGFPGADAAGGACSVHTFDETLGAFEGSYVCTAGQSAALPQGAGFFAYIFADDTPGDGEPPAGFPKPLTTTGGAATAPFSAFALSYTESPARPPVEEGWNLLGNPLATAFDWDAVTPGGGLTETVYVYDPGYLGGDYRAWTRGVAGSGDLTDGVVPAMQGFFVKLDSEPATLEIPAAAVQDPSPGIYGKTDDAEALRIELSVVADGVQTPVSVAFVGASDQAAIGADRLDAPRLTPGAWPRAVLSTFSLGDDSSDDAAPLLLNALPSDAAGELALPLQIAADGYAAGALSLVLTWSGTLADGWRTVLVDRELDTRTEMVPEASYAFTLDVPEAGAAPRPRPAALGLDLRLPGTASLAKSGGGAPVATGDRFVLEVTPGEPVAGEGSALPVTLALLPASPNPSRGAVALRYDVPVSGTVSLAVYDALGREVARLADGAVAAGRHTASLRAGALAPGVYVVRLTSAEGVAVRTLTVVR